MKRFWKKYPLLVALGIAVILMSFFFLFLILFFFLTHCQRIHKGPLHDKYMGRIFKMQPSREEWKNEAFYLNEILRKGEYFFTKYEVGLKIHKDFIFARNLKKFNEPPVYEVIDMYNIINLGGNRNYIVCILHNLKGYEDVLFEQPIENSIGEYTTTDLDITDNCESQWDLERYNKVINSKRYKLHRIKNIIKPGNQKKKDRFILWY